MSLPENTPPSRPAGYGLVHLILAAVAGAVFMVILYASGVMSSVSKAASKTVGGGQDIVSLDTVRYEQTKKIREIAAEVASEQKKKTWQITADDLKNNPKIKQMGLDTAQQAMTLQAALSPPPPNETEPPKLEGYRPVDLSDTSSKIYNYSVLKEPTATPGVTPQSPSVVSFGEEYAKKSLAVYRIEVTPKPVKGPDGKLQPGREPQTVYFGPVDEESLNKQIDQVKAQVDVKMLPIEGSSEKNVPARFYANSEGKLILVIEGNLLHPERVVSRGPVSYYSIPANELKDYMKEREKDAAKPLPPSEQAAIAVLRKS